MPPTNSDAVTAGTFDHDAIARIIDPDAWHETLPTDGCGAYWIGRRNDARVKAKLAVQEIDGSRRCFTYCGDEKCNCPAREAFSLLGWIGGALPVLETMCRAASLPGGASKAAEMTAALAKARPSTGEMP